MTPPTRDRAKAMGFMWKGEIEVITIENLQLIFHMWHHFFADDGESFVPSKKALDAAWSIKFIPSSREGKELVDAGWHTIYEGDHVYISEKGWFGFDARTKSEIVSIIKDGSWVNDSDIWMLL